METERAAAKLNNKTAGKRCRCRRCQERLWQQMPVCKGYKNPLQGEPHSGKARSQQSPLYNKEQEQE
jgi:hypothetical protein